MPLSISICKDSQPSAVRGWEQAEVKSYSELATLMKQYPYSCAIFAGGIRRGENVEGFGNLLVFDVDNDPGKPELKIDEAKRRLEGLGISAMILPSRSHLKDKNGHIAERYRIVIPTNRPFESIDLEEYREFAQTAAKALGIEKFVDTKALKDRARFYYRSPADAVPVVIKADRVMQIDRIEKIAIERVEKRREQKEAERRKTAEIRAEIMKHRAAPALNRPQNILSYANVQKIIDTPIAPVIRAIEGGEAYAEGSYQMIKTKMAKYSIIEGNVAHDFKSDKTYNPLTYLQERLNTANLNVVARKLEEITGERYMELNIEAVEQAVKKARQTASNDKTFEEAIRRHFGVKFCKFDNESIKIADQEIALEALGVEKKDIIEDFRLNREEIKRRQEAEQSRGFRMEM